jgi:hypothetical protein
MPAEFKLFEAVRFAFVELTPLYDERHEFEPEARVEALRICP